MTQETGKAPRRGGGDTRRSLPVCRHECLYTVGLSAAVLPPPTLRTSLFVRHSRRFTTQNSLFHSSGDPTRWIFRGTGDEGEDGGEFLYGLYPADNDCTFLKRSETMLKRCNRHPRVRLQAGGTFEIRIRITPRTQFCRNDCEKEQRVTDDRQGQTMALSARRARLAQFANRVK